MVAKNKEKNVILAFQSCVTCTCSIDFWMSHVGHDTFAMVVNFINSSWQPIHVTIGIFEDSNIESATMINKVKNLLDSFGLLDKVIAYVKNKGSNLNTLTFALNFVVSCSTL
jgi:hypothetical protein